MALEPIHRDSVSGQCSLPKSTICLRKGISFLFIFFYLMVCICGLVNKQCIWLARWHKDRACLEIIIITIIWWCFKRRFCTSLSEPAETYRACFVCPERSAFGQAAPEISPWRSCSEPSTLLLLLPATLLKSRHFFLKPACRN